MDTIINQLIGFLVGLFTSFVFWYFLLRMKPKVVISPIVVFNPNENKFQIKIYNNSRRQVNDVQAMLTVSELQTRSEKNYTKNIHKIPLKNSTLPALGSKRSYGKPWTLLCVFTFTTVEEKEIIPMLKSEISNERRLVFTLTASDAFSGTKVTQRVSYRLKDIRIGKFDLGLNFKVIEEKAIKKLSD